MKNVMGKIKIVNIIHSLVFGGTETFLYNYYTKMDLSKFDIYVITMKKSDEKAISRLESIGIKVILVNDWEKKPFHTFKEILKIFKMYKFDILHSHLTHTNFYFMILGRVAHIKVRISHSHLFEPQKNKITLLKHNIYKILIKLFSTDYVACSFDAARELYDTTNGVVILKNAIDLEKYEYNSKIRELYRKKFNISENTILYGNIGRMSKQKNQIFLLDVFSEIKKKQRNSKLLIVGEGILKEDIQKKIENENLKDDVIILSCREDINCIYQMIDFIIFPSLYEGLGITLIEAQVSGIKCFASDEVIPKDVQVTERMKFISLNENAKSWAEKILSEDKGERKSYSDIISQKGFDIKKECQKLERLYIRELKLLED